MTNSHRLKTTTALALTLALGLAGCGADDDTAEVTPVEQTSVNAEATTPAEETQETSDDAAGGDAVATSQDQTGDDAGDTQTSDVQDTGAATGNAEGDLTATALAAIQTAETEAGGTAYEIDDQDDDGTWEVDVRVEDHSVEVTVSADGTEVLETEQDDLDGDDRAALDAATITLSEAIELSIAEVGGVLDDAELEDEDDGQPHHWEVSVDTDSRDDIDVLVSVTGEILGTDS